MTQKINRSFNYLYLRSSIFITSIVCLLFLIYSSPLSYSAEVTLTWDANAESDLAGYILYYKTGSSGEPYDGTGIDQGNSGINIFLDEIASPSNPRFLLTGLQDNEPYYFVITAVNNAGLESRYSNEFMHDSGSTALPISMPWITLLLLDD